ncbi:MAG: peptidylprolyl isomerase [Bacteroidales bacterium]|nr:peptidylprolyl isomerase [Bacteroidales bacterium]
MKIEANKFVAVSYDLNVGDDKERELMEKATKENPLTFIGGMGMMLDAFERNLNGLSKGDKFEFTLTPEEAYGEYNDEHLIDLPKNLFEVEGKFDTDIVYEGNIVPMLDTNGNRLNGMVVSIGDDSVKMDFNHPLAGETLYFSGEVLEVREATAEEIAALAAPSCGCGCSGCDSEEGGCSSSNGCGSGCGCNE